MASERRTMQRHPVQCAADVLCVVQVAYNFTLPYESLVQKDGLTYPVVFWRDAEKGLSRMDTFGGRNILITGKVSELAQPICALTKRGHDRPSPGWRPVPCRGGSWRFSPGWKSWCAWAMRQTTMSSPCLPHRWGFSSVCREMAPLLDVSQCPEKGRTSGSQP